MNSLTDRVSDAFSDVTCSGSDVTGLDPSGAGANTGSCGGSGSSFATEVGCAFCETVTGETLGTSGREASKRCCSHFAQKKMPIHMCRGLRQ